MSIFQKLRKAREFPSGDLFNYAWIKGREQLSGLAGTLRFKLLARLFGVSYGPGLQCWGPVDILRQPGGIIRLGANVSLVSTSRRCGASSIFAAIKLRTYSPGAEISIGNDVGLNGTSITVRSTRISIGDGTMVGPNVTLMDSNFHALWPPETRLKTPDVESDRPVDIGRNVWIGTQAIILKGVTVGDNAIIGAGSVVTRDIPANVVAAGNPARVVRGLP